MLSIKSELSLLGLRQRMNFILLVVLQFIGVMLDLVGIGLVVPMIYSVNNNEVINKFDFISNYLYRLSENSKLNFLLYMIICLLVFNFFRILFLVYLNYKKNSYAYNLRLNISSSIFDKFLSQEYSLFIQKNSAEVIRSILSDVDGFVNQYLIPLSEMLCDLILFCLLVAIALFYDPQLTIILVSILTIFVLIINFKLSFISKSYGEKRVAHYTKSFQFLQEGLGAIKEIKMYGAKFFFVNRFKDNYKLFVHYARRHTLIVELPRFAIELLVFILLFIVVFYSSFHNYSFSYIIGLIVGFMVLSLRLLPIVNKLQINYQTIQNNKHLTDHIIKIIKECSSEIKEKEYSLRNDDVRDLPSSSSAYLELDQVYFAYNSASNSLLKGISLRISEGEVIGIVGKSGSGKSTLSNILLGLIQPDLGQVSYKGNNIELDKDAYIKKVGYVPQFVYLMDDSMAANIAFGRSSKDIDIAKVKSLIDLLGLTEFVEQMSYGINTPLGDRGVTLSGGQIQRLGIARALYINPEILILDEATSALDSETQGMILDRILLDNPRITVIMITHRVEVLDYCTSVYEVKNGQLKKIKNSQHEGE
jgi:ATP-binding cassette, subfamily B, bacterial PglK